MLNNNHKWNKVQNLTDVGQQQDHLKVKWKLEKGIKKTKSKLTGNCIIQLRILNENAHINENAYILHQK